jgi:hypothetical protein
MRRWRVTNAKQLLGGSVDELFLLFCVYFFRNITAGTERKGITFTGKGEPGERPKFVRDQARNMTGEAPLCQYLVMFDLSRSVFSLK